jgi:hypothetical protein
MISVRDQIKKKKKKKKMSGADYSAMKLAQLMALCAERSRKQTSAKTNNTHMFMNE